MGEVQHDANSVTSRSMFDVITRPSLHCLIYLVINLLCVADQLTLTHVVFLLKKKHTLIQIQCKFCHDKSMQQLTQN